MLKSICGNESKRIKLVFLLVKFSLCT